MEYSITGKAPSTYLCAWNVRKGLIYNDGGTNTVKTTQILATKYFTGVQADDKTFWEYLENCGRPFLHLKVLFTRKSVTEKKLEKLLQSLGNESADVRNEAACDLTDLIGSDISADLKTEIVDSLIKALEDKSNWCLRDGAAFAMEYFTESEISADLKARMVDPLIKAMADENASVRGHAKNALENLVDYDISLVDSDISAKIKSKIVDAFIDALGNNNWIIRDLAADALSFLSQADISTDLKKKMVEPLIKAAEDRYWPVENGAAYALENLSWSDIPSDLKEKMIDPLIKILGTKYFGDKHENAIIRTHAAYAIENLVKSNISRESKIKMIDPLIEALADTNSSIQGSATRSLKFLAGSDIPVELKLKIMNKLMQPKTVEA
jgi:HEAT repeat protein